MSAFSDKMKGLARDAAKTLVLAEGLEERTVRAARIIMDEKIAKNVILVGDEAKVKSNAESLGVSLEGITISDPATRSSTCSAGERCSFTWVMRMRWLPEPRARLQMFSGPHSTSSSASRESRVPPPAS